MDTPTVSTHAGRGLSRLSMFRMKDAARRRDLALLDVEERYQREVRAILDQDRPAAVGLRRLERGNLYPWWHCYRYVWPPQKGSVTNTLCEAVLEPFAAAIKPGIALPNGCMTMNELVRAVVRP